MVTSDLTLSSPLTHDPTCDCDPVRTLGDGLCDAQMKPVASSLGSVTANFMSGASAVTSATLITLASALPTQEVVSVSYSGSGPQTPCPCSPHPNHCPNNTCMCLPL